MIGDWITFALCVALPALMVGAGMLHSFREGRIIEMARPDLTDSSAAFVSTLGSGVYPLIARLPPVEYRPPSAVVCEYCRVFQHIPDSGVCCRCGAPLPADSLYPPTPVTYPEDGLINWRV